ncbi:putative porphobilinogen deaminase, partial [Dissostichus eleginoides]
KFGQSRFSLRGTAEFGFYPGKDRVTLMVKDPETSNFKLPAFQRVLMPIGYLSRLHAFIYEPSPFRPGSSLIGFRFSSLVYPASKGRG